MTGSNSEIRQAKINRVTKESAIDISIALVPGKVEIDTGLPFFDHMLNQLGKHGGLTLSISAKGDLEVDAHHCVEDVGIALGNVFRQSLGDKSGINRFSSVLLPLDEALIEVALDVSGRPFLVYDVKYGENSLPLGDPPFEPQLSEEFFRAFVSEAGITLHVISKSGINSHHILEATFKAVARAIKDAIKVEGNTIPSTKGTLG